MILDRDCEYDADDNVIVWTWYDVKRSDRVRIVPIGDIHIGNASAEKHEKGLKKLIKNVSEDKNAYAILMGDICEFINVQDKRFDPRSLASFVTMKDLVDVAGAQMDMAKGILAPLSQAGKILASVKGNHEDVISYRTERDVHSEMVTHIRQQGRIKKKIGIDMGGWLILKFARSKRGETLAGVSTIKISLHHGFTGGKLAGAKALNMQRWLWNHECDIALHGHSHDTKIMIEAVESVDRTGKIVDKKRLGCITGNWMGRAKYANKSGYYPCPIGYVDIEIAPRVHAREDRIRATAVVLA